MVLIVPAILSKTEEDYKTDITKLNESESFREGWVHIDFADNNFVPNQSIGPEIVVKYPTNLKKEAHLMVEHPIQMVHELVEQKFDRILLHLESEPKNTKSQPWLNDLLSNLHYIEDHGLHLRKEGIENGLAIKLSTPLQDLSIYLDTIDALLIMGIEPGFQGRQFEEKTLERIREVAKIRKERNLNFKIGVDGGVKDHNAKAIVDAGADYLVSGSFILNGNIDENVEKIWEAIEG